MTVQYPLFATFSFLNRMCLKVCVPACACVCICRRVQVVVDAETFLQRMPHVVEAVFSLRLEACGEEGGTDGAPRSCKEYARSVRDTLVASYGSPHQRETIPLLELDLYDWEEPFVSASATDADVTTKCRSSATTAVSSSEA